MINYSIIIPHKNIPELLQRCLDSIPRRDDIQIIVVDDNSDSDKVDFDHFPGLGEKCVEIYFTKEGKGAGYARNVGLEHAIGKWLLFADADDYYTNGAFDILDSELNDNLEILYFNVFSNVQSDTNRAYLISLRYQKYLVNGDDRVVRFGCWSPWNKAISHKLLLDKFLRFEEIPVGNDAMFNLKVSLYAKKYKIIQSKLYCLVDVEGSITFRKPTYERLFNYMKVGVKINNFMYENSLKSYCVPLFSKGIIMRLLILKGPYGLWKYIKYVVDNSVKH